MAQIEIDIAHDCTPDHDTYTKKVAKRHGVKVTLLKLIGPAGGNPLYKFEGTRDALTSLIHDTHGSDDDTAEYLISLIKN